MDIISKLTDEERKTEPEYAPLNDEISNVFITFISWFPKIFKWINIIYQWAILIIVCIANYFLSENVYGFFAGIIIYYFLILIYSYNVHIYRPSTEKGLKYELWRLSMVSKMRKDGRL